MTGSIRASWLSTSSRTRVVRVAWETLLRAQIFQPRSGRRLRDASPERFVILDAYAMDPPARERIVVGPIR